MANWIKPRGIRLGLFLALLLALAAGNAQAQSTASGAGWPGKPIKLVVAFPAGSSTDVIARILGQMLSARVGQSFVIENRIGASGMIGAEAVAHALPDGYTFGLATTSTHALAPSLSANLHYDPLRDFAPVSMVGSSPYVMVTSPGLETRSVQDFIALAKARPGKLTYGSAGPGSLAHLASVLFSNLVGVELTHVPYKSSGQSVTDLMAGRLDMEFSTIPPTLPLIRNRQIRALATTGGKRTAALPELPTVAEAGVGGFEAVLWVAMVAPASVPQPIVARLNRALNEVLAQPEAQAALAAQGMDAEAGAPDALRARIAGDIERWRSIVAAAGIQPE
jgi:tripartite-type tricarboxylate transporter receptor subunit TctC